MNALQEIQWAFVVDYHAEGLGSPDPEWRGPEPRSIQDTKGLHCTWGTLALWLAAPSPAHFNVVVHAPRFENEEQPVVQQALRHNSTLLCHPRDVHVRVGNDAATRAGRLHVSMLGVGHETALYYSLRAMWAALQMNVEAVRYALFWIALEALFGPEDGRELSFRLGQRISLFLAPNRAAARDLSKTIKKAYGFRSKIVHGRWSREPNSLDRMADVEGWVRAAITRLLTEPDLATMFSVDRRREDYLDGLAY